MASYDYTCDNTDCEFFDKTVEVKHSMVINELKLCWMCEKETLRRLITSAAGGHRIGGGHNPTSMWNVSGDPGPRRKGYDCDPMN